MCLGDNNAIRQQSTHVSESVRHYPCTKSDDWKQMESSSKQCEEMAGEPSELKRLLNFMFQGHCEISSGWWHLPALSRVDALVVVLYRLLLVEPYEKYVLLLRKERDKEEQGRWFLIFPANEWNVDRWNASGYTHSIRSPFHPTTKPLLSLKSAFKYVLIPDLHYIHHANRNKYICNNVLSPNMIRCLLIPKFIEKNKGLYRGY